MIRLSNFYRNDDIFKKVSEQVKSTKWINIDSISPFSREEELLAIYYKEELIGYIHIEDVTEDTQKCFGITKFFIFPNFQNQGYGKEAALALFKKQSEEGYTNIIMQVENKNSIQNFWKKVITLQELFNEENIEIIIF
ncbi:GNAT family N-acetyltransferase [Avibacterium sp. 20-15]|uniref:GNAT family N-acetyltransferase n=1 Tax=unclassified Avibacterium TaxID=2685287 RepID=UPI0020263C07|nr:MULTISPECIES: GNAT family N-acetyltransferase [unclassified Avibacterium]MCW9732912.1 GNAT family N-acetyltransferase [Avibacterium sp. 20-15]URL05047.1 GNAT family N-acetyltransferase [Avibacterium sp. 20-132]